MHYSPSPYRNKITSADLIRLANEMPKNPYLAWYKKHISENYDRVAMRLEQMRKIRSMSEIPEGNIRARLVDIDNKEAVGLEAFYEPDIKSWVKPSGEIFKQDEIAKLGWIEE